MHEIIVTFNDIIKELDSFHGLLKKKKTIYVDSGEEKDFAKAVAYSWIKAHRIKFLQVRNLVNLSEIDELYSRILDYSDNRTRRSTYLSILGTLKKKVLLARAELIRQMDAEIISNRNLANVPDFSLLISDSVMIDILKRRWLEIGKCLKSDCPLSATVMMGGLLESVLLTKINQLEDKSILFKQKSTPTDRTTGKPKPLPEWMLKDFIDVSHEIKIITKPSAEFCRIIRDYRNYIHPEKERRQGEVIHIKDAKLFWITTAEIMNQLLDN